MKIILFLSNHANQRALAARLAEHLPLHGIVLFEPATTGVRAGLTARAARLARGVFGFPLRRAWLGMLSHYDRQFPNFPIAPALAVHDINAEAVHSLITKARPDLVIVSGTNLLKRPLIERLSKTSKVMNLHTGLSPYVRGAPNCTNWCLATGSMDLIGNTVMWIDEGIDSGNIIATERTPLEGSESLTELHIKVMDHAHALMMRCAALFVAGRSLPNVPQSEVASGRLYLSRQWGPVAAAKAVINFYRSYPKARKAALPGLRLIDPEPVN